jgi:hypothetical protein
MARTGFVGGCATALVLIAACGGGPRDQSDSLEMMPTSITAASADDGGGSAGEPTGGGADGGQESSTGPSGEKFDVGMGMGEGNGEEGDMSGCDKVDFLFVIDNSGSMGDEQNNLISSFPQFIDTIQQELDEAQDYHVMVLDVDAYVFEQCQVACDPPEVCLDANGNCNAFAAPECIGCVSGFACQLEGGFECGVTTPMECEDVLGAGVTYPRGSGASNQDCAFASGARYMDASEPDLAGTFSCAARVGVGSWASTEKPMEAMVQAVTPGTPAWDCNEGFIRDDAILVVTFITDEDDGNGDSAGTAAGWKQALVAAKNGDEQALVVLGLFGDGCPPLNNNSGAEQSPRLREFVESFGDHGFIGQVCSPSFDQFFEDAVGLIDTTCEEFVPPQG